MNIKQFLVSVIATAISMILLAGLWHEIIASAFYTAETQATHEGTGVIFIAYIVLSFFMVYLYSFYKSSGGITVKGLKFGVLMGLIWVFPHELAMAGAHGESLSYVFKNAAWHAIEQELGGVVVAHVYQRLS